MKIKTHYIRYVLLSAMLVSFFSVSNFVMPVRANSIVVNTDQEIDANNSLCSLYEAVIAANTDSAYNGCPAGSGADIITFADDYTITLLVTQLEILSPITITGRGITNTVIQASDCNPITTPGGCSPAYNRVFYIGNNDVTLSDLTIQYGNCANLTCLDVANSGGGIYSYGNLTLNNVLLNANRAQYGGGLYVSGSGSTALNNVTILGNSADSGDGYGGGAYLSASANFTDVTVNANTAKYGGGIYFYKTYPYNLLRTGFVNNSATAAGGGIYNNLSNPAISASFFSGNSANFYLGGGGIYNSESNPTLANVTFSGNKAENSYGGGMLNNNSDPVLTNVTFSANLAGGGGGLLNTNGSAPTLKNTIIANSMGGGDCVNYSTSLNAASKNNLMEDGSNACGLAHGVNGNVVGLDPNLGSLANNGGPTPTHALLANSRAIDAGDSASCLAADQRDVARPQGSRCDIGSFELEQVNKTFRSTGAYDGWILESGENASKGGTKDNAGTVFRLGDGTADKQYRAILSFNTTSLPDNAIITHVIVKIKKQAPVGTDPFTILGGLKVDIQKPSFGSTLALVITDFEAAALKNAVATFGVNAVNNWYSAVLNTAGKSFVNKTGVTQFRLRFAADDNNDNASDYMKFFSGNHSVAANRPTLIIKYYVP